MNLSGLRAGGDVTADRLPAGMLRAPIVCVPSLQLPPTTQLLFSSHSPRIPHICCVLATDSKLQHPGPLSDSIPISSHVPPLPSFSTIIQLTFSASVYLPHFLSVWSGFLPLSVIFVLAPWLPQPCQISFPCLSFSHFCYTLILHSSIVSRYTAFPPSYTSPPLPIYFLASRSLLSRLHRFLSRFSLLSSFLSLSLKPLLHSTSFTLLLLSLSGNRCCLSDLIITG